MPINPVIDAPVQGRRADNATIGDVCDVAVGSRIEDCIQIGARIARSLRQAFNLSVRTGGG